MKSFHQLGIVVSLSIVILITASIVGAASQSPRVGDTSPYSTPQQPSTGPNTSDTPSTYPDTTYPGTTRSQDYRTLPDRTIPERADAPFSWGSLIMGLLVGGIAGYLFGRSGRPDTMTRPHDRDRVA